MKKILAVLLALMLSVVVFAGCKKKSDSSEQFAQQAESWDAPSAMAPSFLDENQQELYRKAYAAYLNFVYDANAATAGKLVAIQEKNYARSVGAHESWEQLSSEMQKIFTVEFFEDKLNIREDGSWVYKEHEKNLFRQVDGLVKTYRADYLGLDTFEIISQTDAEIQFYVLGHYALDESALPQESDPPSSSQTPAAPPASNTEPVEVPVAQRMSSVVPPEGGESTPTTPEPPSSESVQAEPEDLVEKYLVVLTLAQGEWRFSHFAVSA